MKELKIVKNLSKWINSNLNLCGIYFPYLHYKDFSTQILVFLSNVQHRIPELVLQGGGFRGLDTSRFRVQALHWFFHRNLKTLKIQTCIMRNSMDPPNKKFPKSPLLHVYIQIYQYYCLYFTIEPNLPNGASRRYRILRNVYTESKVNNTISYNIAVVF